MRRLLNILLPAASVMFSCFQSFSQTSKQSKTISNPFDSLNYDNVVAYDYNGSPEMQIVINGQLLSLKGRIYKQKELSTKQIRKLNKILGDSNTYGGSTAACFDPHFGVVYYKQIKIVRHISICLDCNYLMSSAKIPASETKKVFPGDDTDEFYFAQGFSKDARLKISRLVKALQFSHWQLNSDLFDK